MSKIKCLCAYITAAVMVAGIIFSGSAASGESSTSLGISGEITKSEISSNRSAQPEPSAVSVRGFGMDGYEKKLENGRLEIWFDSKNDTIRIKDKSNGYVWGALAGKTGNGLNKSWSNFANSICSVSYYNPNNQEARISMADINVRAAYDWGSDFVNCSFNASKLGISFSFTMRLNEDSISFEMEKDSLSETGKAKLKSIYFIPFFGSAYQNEINGYVLLPDGCGALMRFSKSSTYLNGFDERIYGKDAGIDSIVETSSLNANRINEYLVPANTVTVPVFGVAHGVNQNAYLAVIEDGEEYASVMASPAGLTTDYNWACARFDYRQIYNQSSSVEAAGIPTVQKDANKMTPKISYYFLSGDKANYSGMANLYRELLTENKVLKAQESDGDIPMRVEVAGSTLKKGFIFNSLKILTTTREAENILSTLHDDGVSNIKSVYRSWQKASADGIKYGKIKVSRRLGGISGLRSLKKSADSCGGRLYLYLDPVYANEKQVYKSSDIAINISDSFISKDSMNKDQLFPTKYFAKVSRYNKYFNTYSSKMKNFDFAAGNIGSILYSDYSNEASFSRTETKNQIADILKKSDSAALYNPNAYCWKYAEEYFDMPMANSQYLFETDTVPFLQIVLKGSINYYSQFLNQGYCSHNTILKMIEYGMYPSYIVMAADNYALSKTAMTDYFSLNFDDWRSDMAETYAYVNKALSSVEGSTIVSHSVLRQGVVRVKYSDNTVIYINYNAEDITADGVTVPAGDYIVAAA